MRAPRAVLLALVAALVSTPVPSLAAPDAASGDASRAAAVSPGAAPRVRAVTDLDDAVACEPLDGGRVAVATGGGLAVVARDGAVRALTSLDGLPDTRVHALAVGREPGALWAGTEGGAALVSLEGGSPRVVRTLPGAPVQAVHVASDGTVILATRGGGVLRLAPGVAAPQPLRPPGRGTRATALAEHDGTLYVAYADGPLARLDARAGELRSLEGGPTHGQSLAVAGDALLLGDLEGVYRLDADGFAPVAGVDARGLAASGGTLLVAAYGEGLLSGAPRGALHAVAGAPRLVRGVGVRGSARCVATASGAFVDDGDGAFRRLELGGPPSNDVTALVVSPSGRVAIGTFDAGAAVRDGDSAGGTFRRVPAIGDRETVNGLAWQGDTLWIATPRGVVRSPAGGAARRFTSADGLPATAAHAIAVLGADRVLVGTDAGPALIEGDRVVPVADPSSKHDRTRALSSPMRATFAVSATADGTLLVGTTAGLYYGRPGRPFRRAALATGELADDWVTAIAVDGGDVYVGTYAHGVTRLRLPRNGGRPDAVQLGGGYVNVDGLTVADGRLWASTMEGLLVRDAGAADDSARWTVRPELSTGRDVTAVRRADGVLWVASRRGLERSEEASH